MPTYTFPNVIEYTVTKTGAAMPLDITTLPEAIALRLFTLALANKITDSHSQITVKTDGKPNPNYSAEAVNARAAECFAGLLAGDWRKATEGTTTAKAVDPLSIELDNMVVTFLHGTFGKMYGGKNPRHLTTPAQADAFAAACRKARLANATHDEKLAAMETLGATYRADPRVVVIASNRVKEAAELTREFRKQRIKVGTQDLKIASIEVRALVH